VQQRHGKTLDRQEKSRTGREGLMPSYI
jgi:hypothetical protein